MAGSTFEMQLAQLADAEISQNAPSLAPYKVGFQLVDKDDDETRGFGVSVYLVEGKQWIFVPVFFLNGRLRGYEMMFVPAQQAMRPNQESWISYVKSKLPHNLGKSPGKEGAKDRRMDGPGMIRTGNKQSPFVKGASLMLPDELTDMASYDGLDIGNAIDLRRWVPKLGKRAAADLVATLTSNPDFANAILRHYTPDELSGMVKQAVEENVTTGVTELQVLTPDMPDAQKLEDKEKEVLMRDGIFVVDGRKETSTVFKQDSGHRCLATPTKNGPHDVLMSDGSFCRFHVMVLGGEEIKHGSGYSSNKSPRLALVPYDNPKIAIRPPKDIMAWPADAEGAEKPELGMSLGGLRDQPEMGQVMFFKNGRATVVDYTKGPRTVVGSRVTINSYHSGYGCKSLTLEMTGRPGKIYYASGTLFLPEDTRMCRMAKYDEEKHYSFGNACTVTRQLLGKGGLKPLKVYSDGTSVTISGSELVKDPLKIEVLDKKAAVISLVRKHGIEASVAKAMVKEASGGLRPRAVRYLVKYAQEYPEDLSSIQGKDAPFEESDEEVGGLPQEDADKAIKASENGVKDVMNVSVLKSLAMRHKPMDSVDDMVPDLMNAIDKVGRLLFLFYWHNDAFSDRYGKDSMDELEDSLRDLFRQLGDVALFFATKRVSADASIDNMLGDLTEDLGA
jgi:hypothetical protein